MQIRRVVLPCHYGCVAGPKTYSRVPHARVDAVKIHAAARKNIGNRRQNASLEPPSLQMSHNAPLSARTRAAPPARHGNPKETRLQTTGKHALIPYVHLSLPPRYPLRGYRLEALYAGHITSANKPRSVVCRTRDTLPPGVRTRCVRYWRPCRYRRRPQPPDSRRCALHLGEPRAPRRNGTRTQHRRRRRHPFP